MRADCNNTGESNIFDGARSCLANDDKKRQEWVSRGDYIMHLSGDRAEVDEEPGSVIGDKYVPGSDVVVVEPSDFQCGELFQDR